MITRCRAPRTRFGSPQRTHGRSSAARFPDHPRLRGKNLSGIGSKIAGSGPPPPAREELDGAAVGADTVRTTPACAGRTGTTSAPPSDQPDHPRLRGKNQGSLGGHADTSGPPPPAREERARSRSRGMASGTPPACAGRTDLVTSDVLDHADHPRLRGKNPAPGSHQGVEAGPPPPAREERCCRSRRLREDRTTPACAGRTAPGYRASCRYSDHPRLRGKNQLVLAQRVRHGGPPPPAREERAGVPGVVPELRTTPACAGRTLRVLVVVVARADHPRLRGKNTRSMRMRKSLSGPPPPAREELLHLDLEGGGLRTTPACAGRTPVGGGAAREPADHPRLRGKNVASRLKSAPWPGPPPPAREELHLDDEPLLLRRTTPACAGRTSSSGSGGRRPPDHPRLRGKNDAVSIVAIERGGPPPPAREEPRCT